MGFSSLLASSLKWVDDTMMNACRWIESVAKTGLMVERNKEPPQFRLLPNLSSLVGWHGVGVQISLGACI